MGSRCPDESLAPMIPLAVLCNPLRWVFFKQILNGLVVAKNPGLSDRGREAKDGEMDSNGRSRAINEWGLQLLLQSYTAGV